MYGKHDWNSNNNIYIYKKLKILIHHITVATLYLKQVYIIIIYPGT